MHQRHQNKRKAILFIGRTVSDVMSSRFTLQRFFSRVLSNSRDIWQSHNSFTKCIDGVESQRNPVGKDGSWEEMADTANGFGVKTPPSDTCDTSDDDTSVTARQETGRKNVRSGVQVLEHSKDEIG